MLTQKFEIVFFKLLDFVLENCVFRSFLEIKTLISLVNVIMEQIIP